MLPVKFADNWEDLCRQQNPRATRTRVRPAYYAGFGKHTCLAADEIDDGKLCQ